MSHIAIVGGGASGLIAAIYAARRGHTVTILERMNRVGKKILATGNGRCNITNQRIDPSFYHGHDKDEMMKSFLLFSLEDTKNFFESIGILMKEEEKGKLFPLSLQASSVLDNLRFECQRLGVMERCSFEVTDIIRQKSRFLIKGSEGSAEYADDVILASGGCAASHLGSDGSGYNLAKKMGHTVFEAFPALCKIYVKEDYLKAVAGVKFTGTVMSDTMVSSVDEILFTENGLSGPAIFDLSRFVSDKLSRDQKVSVFLDMFPNMDKDVLFRLLMMRFESMPYKTATENLVGFLPKKLILPILNLSQIPKDLMSSKIEKSQISSLVNLFKKWPFEVSKIGPFKEAQVSCGGVDTSEVDYRTMQSKKCPGLYIVGEVLDIDGDCGGFNLQWAWTSGAIAGKYAGRNDEHDM